MPQVPIAERTVRQAPLTEARFQAADFSGGAETIARSTKRLANATADFADAQDRIDATMDEAAAKQLDVEFAAFERETLWNEETGFYTRQGENALNARGDTEKALAAKRQELLAKAKSPRARVMLDSALGRRVETSLESIGRYSQGQAERYADDVSNARIETTVQEAIAFRDQPDRFEPALHTVRDEVIARGERKGWPPELTLQEAKKAVSGVHVKVVEAIATTDPAEAARYAEINASEIEPLAKLALDKVLSDPLLDQEADEQASAIRGVGSPVAAGPVDFNALAAAVEGQESRGRNGLKSPKGALGVMQVMPGTAKDLCAKLGIPYDEAKLRNDPEYCRRLGREYLKQQMERYGGNTTLALAAYNAGPGAVNEWLKTIGDPRKGEITDAQWAARIPYAETRAYVPGVAKRLGAGGPQNLPRENNLAEQLARADAIENPRLREKVRSKLMTADSVDARLLTDQRQQAADQAWTIAMQPGFTSIRGIPPTLWARLSTEAQRSLSETARKNLTGADAAPNPQLYVQLSDMASQRPDEFSKLNLAEYAYRLPKGDWEQFVTLQRSVRDGGKKAPAAVTHARIVSATTDLAAAVGLTTVGAKDKDKAALAGRLAAFRTAVAEDAAAYVAEHKREPTDLEIRGFADRHLVQVRTREDESWLGDGLSDEPKLLFELGPDDKIGAAVVPASDRARIVAAAKRRLGRPPTEQEVFDAYMKVKGAR